MKPERIQELRKCIDHTFGAGKADKGLEEALDEIESLQAELKKHQESKFHPDWSMLAATRDCLREYRGEIKTCHNVIKKCLKKFKSEEDDIALWGELRINRRLIKMCEKVVCVKRS
ncbi:MAG: hypothetical protein WC511_02835 [Candidatus Pacearchaeota archaeon]